MTFMTESIPGLCRATIQTQVLDADDEICARVSLKRSSAMTKGRPAHLIFGVFVDLKHLGRQLVRFEAFAVKCKQTDVIEHTALAISSF